MSENKDKLSKKTVGWGGGAEVVASGNYTEGITRNHEFAISEIEESKYSTELDEIFTQLHDADRHIAKTRQNTVRLGIETRSMLDDLRKQLG